MLPPSHCELPIYLKADLWSFVFSPHSIFYLLFRLNSNSTIPSNLNWPVCVACMFSLCISHVPQAKVIGTMQWNYYWKKSHLPIHFLSSQWLPDTIVLLLFSPSSSEKRKYCQDIRPRCEWAILLQLFLSILPAWSLKPVGHGEPKFWLTECMWQRTQARWTYRARAVSA